jgi:hypothetical protein
MNASQFNADDITGGKTENVLGNHSNGQPVVLPFMDSNEINKKLEEHKKMLHEWDMLLNKTSKLTSSFSYISMITSCFSHLSGAGSSHDFAGGCAAACLLGK